MHDNIHCIGNYYDIGSFTFICRERQFWHIKAVGTASAEELCTTAYVRQAIIIGVRQKASTAHSSITTTLMD
jgi:hypothetical protein